MSIPKPGAAVLLSLIQGAAGTFLVQNPGFGQAPDTPGEGF